MIGLWEAGMGPQRMNLHVAFSVDLDNLLQAADRLREANIIPLDFAGEPTDEPVVFAWMPAASLFFHDPDGNLLEFLSMLPDAPQCDLGIVGWSRWKSAQANEARTPRPLPPDQDQHGRLEVWANYSRSFRGPS